MHHPTQLHIANPKCKPSWLRAMKQGLAGNTSLKLIKLAVAKTDTKHAKALAHGLRDNPSLEEVDIELGNRTQILIVLKSLLGVLPSANGPDTPHGARPGFAIPRLRKLVLRANNGASTYRWGWFDGKACRLLTRLIEERTHLEKVELAPGLCVGNQKRLARLRRATDRQMVELHGDQLHGHGERVDAPRLDISELRRRQNLFASPAALRAAAGSLNFNATPDGIPLSADAMAVIASHLPIGSQLRTTWILRGLLSVNKETREVAIAARSSAHAERLLRLLESKPDDMSKSISQKKKKAVAHALADMWRLSLAGIPLRREDANRVALATKSSPVWNECKDLLREKTTSLLRQHNKTIQLLEKAGSPQAAYAKELSRDLKPNQLRFPA